MRPLLLFGLLSLATVATAQPDRPAAADSALAVYTPPPKDPMLATMVALFMPGGGHLYAGETQTGLVLMGLSVGAPLAGVFMSIESCDSDGFFGCSNDDATLTPLLVGLGIGLGAQLYSIADAGSAAHRANRRAEHTWTLHPTIVPSQQGPRTGLALTARF